MRRTFTMMIMLAVFGLLGGWLAVSAAAQEKEKPKPPRVEPRDEEEFSKPSPEWSKPGFGQPGGERKQRPQMPPGMGLGGQPGMGPGHANQPHGFGPGFGAKPGFPGRPQEGPPQGPPFGMKPDGWGQPLDPEMRQLDQAEREMERKCIDRSMRFRDAAKEDRAALQKELAEAVNKHFELRQQRRELKMKRLEEELQRLRDAIKRRQDAREEIVKKRVSELLGEAEDMRF